jgi:hypothetical protein
MRLRSLKTCLYLSPSSIYSKCFVFVFICCFFTIDLNDFHLRAAAAVNLLNCLSAGGNLMCVHVLIGFVNISITMVKCLYCLPGCHGDLLCVWTWFTWKGSPSFFLFCYLYFFLYYSFPFGFYSLIMQSVCQRHAINHFESCCFTGPRTKNSNNNKKNKKRYKGGPLYITTHWPLAVVQLHIVTDGTKPQHSQQKNTKKKRGLNVFWWKSAGR